MVYFALDRVVSYWYGLVEAARFAEEVELVGLGVGELLRARAFAGRRTRSPSRFPLRDGSCVVVSSCLTSRCARLQGDLR